MSKFRTVASLSLGALALTGLSACSGGAEEATPAPATETAESMPATTEAESAGPNTAAPSVVPVAYASLTGDAANGAKVFLQCKACHVLEAGQNRVGPSLHQIVGRTAGQVAGYSYSAANKNSGIVWTEDQLYTYLEAPRTTIPGTKMSFVGLKKPQDRADVIAYLKTTS